MILTFDTINVVFRVFGHALTLSTLRDKPASAHDLATLMWLYTESHRAYREQPGKIDVQLDISTARRLFSVFNDQENVERFTEGNDAALIEDFHKRLWSWINS